MKRAISLALTLALLLCLTACGGTKTAAVTEAPTEAVTETPTEAPTEAEVSAENAVGVFSDGVYTNEMLGLQAAFDEESWYVASAEERMEVVGILADAATDADIADLLRETGSAMDLYALQANGSGVNLMLEKVNFLQGALISEEQYLALSEEQMPDALAAMQVEDAQVEKASVEFGGKTHPAMRITGTMSGMDFFEQLVVVKAGGYFGVVTAACYGEDITEDILALFTGI